MPEKTVEYHAKKLMETNNLDVIQFHIGALKEAATPEAIDALVKVMGYRISKATLWDHDPSTKAGIPIIPSSLSAIQAIEKDRAKVGYQCADALAEIGEPAVPALIKTLEYKSPEVATQSANTLVEIGTPAVPALIKALEHENPKVVFNSAWALGRIGNKEAIPALIKSLDHNNENVIKGSADALSTIGDKKALPALMKHVGRHDLLTNSLIKSSIKQIQEANKRA